MSERVKAWLARRECAHGARSWSVRWVDPTTGRTRSRRVVRSSWHPTYRMLQQYEHEAFEARREIERVLNSEHEWRKLERVSIDDAIERYLAWAKLNRSKSSYERYDRLLCDFANYLRRAEPAVTVVYHLLLCHAAHHRDHLLERGLGSNTVAGYLSDLSAWCKWCIGEGWIETNPWRQVNRPNTLVNERYAQFKSHQEVLDLLSRARTTLIAAKVAVLAYTGLRRDEAAHLRADEDIDWYNGLIHVPRGDRERTKKHERVIPVIPALRGWMLILRMEQDLGPYLLGPDRGERPATTQVNTICKQLGTSPRYLRRFFRYALESCEIQPYIIDDLMGHVASRVRQAYTPEFNLATATMAMERFQRWLSGTTPEGSTT